MAKDSFRRPGSAKGLRMNYSFLKYSMLFLIASSLTSP
jgi:hypothetical protein